MKSATTCLMESMRYYGHVVQAQLSVLKVRTLIFWACCSVPREAGRIITLLQDVGDKILPTRYTPQYVVDPVLLNQLGAVVAHGVPNL